LLVTPDIAKVRDRLPELFQSGKISRALVIDDVDVVGPENPVFHFSHKMGQDEPWGGQGRIWLVRSMSGATSRKKAR
jgi:hypothetical protein